MRRFDWMPQEETENYYDMLEISPNASPEIVKKAYYTLVQRYHPDQFHSHYKEYATRRTKRLNEAYRVLSDPEQRRAYDSKLAAQTRITSFAPKRTFSPVIRIVLITVLVFVTLRFLLFSVKLALVSPVFQAFILLTVVAGLYWLMRSRFLKSKTR